MNFSYVFIRSAPVWWNTREDIMFAMHPMRTMKLGYEDRAQEEVVKLISALEDLLKPQD